MVKQRIDGKQEGNSAQQNDCPLVNKRMRHKRMRQGKDVDSGGEGINRRDAMLGGEGATVRGKCDQTRSKSVLPSHIDKI